MWELDTQGWTQESDSGPSLVLSCTPSLCSQQLVGATYIVPDKIAVVHSYQLLPYHEIQSHNCGLFLSMLACWVSDKLRARSYIGIISVILLNMAIFIGENVQNVAKRVWERSPVSCSPNCLSAVGHYYTNTNTEKHKYTNTHRLVLYLIALALSDATDLTTICKWRNCLADF